MKGAACFLIFILAAAVAHARVESEAEAAGLRGPVRSVTTETTKFSRDKQQFEEGIRQVTEQVSFNLLGMMTEKIDSLGHQRFDHWYYKDGKLAGRTNLSNGSEYVYAYEKGKITKYFMTGRFGQLISRDVLSFDDDNRLVSLEYTCYTRRGCLGAVPKVVTFKYDGRGRLIEEVHHEVGGKPSRNMYGVHRYSTQYLDDETKEVSAIRPDGTLISKARYKFDKKGYLREFIQFGSSLSSIAKTVYLDRDRHGNWTKCSSFKILQNEGKTIEEPTENKYRTITYY